MKKLLLALILSLGTMTPAYADNEPCQGENACQGRQKKGCAEAQAPCSDDDKQTVVVCLPQSTCNFSPPQEESP